eukprot:m.99571 g.99571  ORF g.99571 m.99571 type:complete len:272 (+) comp10312_c0_seq1:752-1567(+)
MATSLRTLSVLALTHTVLARVPTLDAACPGQTSPDSTSGLVYLEENECPSGLGQVRLISCMDSYCCMFCVDPENECQSSGESTVDVSVPNCEGMNLFYHYCPECSGWDTSADDGDINPVEQPGTTEPVPETTTARSQATKKGKKSKQKSSQSKGKKTSVSSGTKAGKLSAATSQQRLSGAPVDVAVRAVVASVGMVAFVVAAAAFRRARTQQQSASVMGFDPLPTTVTLPGVQAAVPDVSATHLRDHAIAVQSDTLLYDDGCAETDYLLDN